jgi:hypothetical protein
MAIENIVRVSELDAFIAETIKKVNDGVAKARTAGVLAELPKEIQFDVILIREWEALQITGGEEGETTENQGGYQTETNKSGSSKTSSGTEDRTSQGENHHTQNTDSQQETYTI